MAGAFEEQARTAEYASLRAEILQDARISLQVVGIAFSATAIIIAQGIAQSGAPGMAFAFLFPFPILWICSTYVTNTRWSILRIASYIRVCIEGISAGPRWETRLANQREKYGGGIGLKFNISVVECILFNAWGVTCLWLFFAFGGASLGILYGLLAALLFAALFVSSVIQYIGLARANSNRRLDEQWREILEHEHAEQ